MVAMGDDVGGRHGLPSWSWAVPEQRRQQDYRALRERAERISDGD
jgi:hypothetical protein